jgi:glycosyltransferase involved in cell wall biosynthesis
MKVGFDAKRAFHNNSGLGNYSRDLIRILSHGMKDDSFVLYNPKSGKRKFNFNASNTEEVTPKGLWNNFRSAWRSLEIGKLAQKTGLSVYHGLSNELPSGLGNVKSIVTIHDLIFERFPEWYKPIDRKIYRQKFKSAALNADSIVAISEQTKNDLVDFYQIPKEKIKVIYQGCHKAFKEDTSAEDQKQLRLKFQLPEKYILSVGTIEPRKNLLTIVKAIKAQPEVNLVIVGKETKYAKEIKTFIAEHLMEHRVFFLKNVTMPELAGIYQMASVFVYASQFEGFGIPIIEALFSKTPVITSTGSCFSEAGGPDSIYLPFNDVQAWSSEISQLYNNQNTQNEMAEIGHVYAQKFQDEVILELWKKTYDSFR